MEPASTKLNSENMLPKAIDEEARAQLRAVFQAKLNAPPAPPLEAATNFFRSFFADNSWDEAKERLTKLASRNTRGSCQC